MPINSLFSYFIKKRLDQIDFFKRYPHETQREVFHGLIRAARFTEWGKENDYKSIDNLKTFKDRVPVQRYEDLKPYVDRLKKGEQNLLWPTDIKWFAKSSGTTNDKSKYIPVSREALEECHFKGGKDLVGLHCHMRPKTRIYTGRSLVVGGSRQVNELRTDSYSGDLSAIVIKNLPLWVEIRQTPDRAVALMDGWEEKIEQMARITMKDNVKNIVGVPSWTLVLLRRILDISGADNINEIWPDLELYIHGGVSFRPYKEQFRSLIPNPAMNYLDSYNASEGFFGVQDIEGSDEMLLMLDYGIFYEFMPMSELGKEHPETLELSEVQVGVNYAIIISTNAGLWRYLIGDTIVFTSTDPYRIQVSGRTKHFINAFGEELIIDNAEKALEVACERSGALISDYTAAPIFMDHNAKGGHEWLIEFEKEPEDRRFFTGSLDNALKSLNSDYEAKRTGDLSLGMPVVRPMPAGTFQEWLKSKGKLGGQHKVPRLSNNRDVVDDIMARSFVKDVTDALV